MDLEQLRSLLAIADGGSLSEAARRLDHPKSSVVKRIGQLERDLGVRLLDRGQRQVRLSDSAQNLLAQARDIVARAEDLALAARTRSGSTAGRLRLSVPTLLGQTLLPAMLGRFAGSHAQVELTISAEDRYVDLVAEGFDCAIRMGPGTDPALVRRKLATSTLVLVASPALAAAAGASHPAELDGVNAIGFDAEPGAHAWRLRSGTQHHDLDANVRLTYRSLPAIAQLLKSHPAVAMLPKFLVQQQILGGELLHVCPAWQGESHDISIMFASREYLPDRLRRLIDHLVEEFRELDL